MLRFLSLLLLLLLAWQTPRATDAEPNTQVGMQSVTLNVNSQEILVNYPTGHNVTALATEIVEKLNLSEGFGCTTSACVVGVLAEHLRTKEPQSLNQWLQNSGWSDAQIAMLNDVVNINFWHFAMLNDADRNEKFDVAIRAAVARARARARAAGGGAGEEGEVCVLDLGSGSGLLAMMSARAGADVVHAIEMSALLSDVGPQIVRRNGFRVALGADGEIQGGDATAGGQQPSSSPSPPPPLVRWHHKSSEAMTLDGDLGGRRCAVLVSETLGVSVLDEAGLKFMSDLRDRLLLQSSPPLPSPLQQQPPLSQQQIEVIPARVVTYAAVVRCESLLRLSWVDAAAGFDVSPMNSFRHSKMKLRRMSKDWGFMLSEADPPAEMVAGPFEIMTVDFLRDRATAFDGGINVTRTLPVRPGKGGDLHAVVAWFEAELDPAGDVRLSTSPWASDNSFARQQHWGQLVELLPLSYEEVDGAGGVGGRPLRAEEGASVRLTSHIASTGGAGSIYFPQVEVVRDA